tara:strand:- start:361 stop:876 length:516 start_codon:yes stop_codon:yes gene_type:complete
MARNYNIPNYHTDPKAESLVDMALRFPQRVVSEDGTRGLVVKISPSLVAKFRRVTGETDELFKEFHIANRLHKGGVLVPEPEGIFEIPFKVEGYYNCGSAFPALVMEFVDGHGIKELYGNELREALESASRQYIKAERLGFHAADKEGGNFIWAPDKGGSFLIDFEFWSKF